MGCFLIMTETDFAKSKSSIGNRVHYLSQTSSGVFVEVVGDAKKETKEIVAQIRGRFPAVQSEKMHLHHLIPQQFKPEFEKLGIDIDDYAVPIASKDHIGSTGLHNAEFRYNNYWSAFLEEHEGAPPELIRLHAARCISECMNAYNINFDTTVRYKR